MSFKLSKPIYPKLLLDIFGVNQENVDWNSYQQVGSFPYRNNIIIINKTNNYADNVVYTLRANFSYSSASYSFSSGGLNVVVRVNYRLSKSMIEPIFKLGDLGSEFERLKAFARFEPTAHQKMEWKKEFKELTDVLQST